MSSLSNSSSLSSYEEIITIKPINEDEESKNNKKNKNNQFTKFVKNAQNWNSNIKFVDINNKKHKDKENEQNCINTSLINHEIYKYMNLNPFEKEKRNNYSEDNKFNNFDNSKNFGVIKKTGGMTPSVKNNLKFFKPKFGKTKLENNKKKRKSYNFIVSNSASGKNYYNVLKEINKLIKYVANAQEIFSKKTIKIKFKNSEKKLNLSSKPLNKGKIIKSKKSITKKSILKKKNIKSNLFQKEEEANESYVYNDLEKEKQFFEQNDIIESEINIIGLIVEIFKKPIGIRNKDELYFIEHYLMTFENVMKIMQQNNLGPAGNDLPKKIARNMEIDIIPKDTIICKLGDNGDKFYVIFQGNVAILIPKETNAKMDINEYINYLKKLQNIGEYELAIKTIESNLHVYKNKEIIYLEADIKKYLYLNIENNKRENLSVIQYMERIDSLSSADIINYNMNNTPNNNLQSNLLFDKNNNFIKDDPVAPLNPIKKILDDNVFAKNIGMTNFINRKKLSKQSISLTSKKLLEIKNHSNFNSNSNLSNTKEDNTNINSNNNFLSVKIPLKKRKFTTKVFLLTKNEEKEKDLNNSNKKSNKNIIQESPSKNINNDLEFKKSNKAKKFAFKSTRKVLTQQNNNILIQNKNNEESITKDNNKDIKHNVILWTYFNVTNLIDGQVFGDVALSENNKRRTATIITQEKTICGTLDCHIYNKFVKDAQKRIRKNVVHSLLNVNFLKGINVDVFEEHYFNMFKYNCIHRDDYLFRAGEVRNSIFIIISGEIEVTITCSIQKLNKILKIKNVNLEDAIKFEERLCMLNDNFNHFYNKTDNIFRIVVRSFGCCLGLNEFTIPKEDKDISENKNIEDLFYVNAKCISDKAEFYSIDYKLLNNIFKNEKKEQIFEEIIQNYEKDTLLRIIKLKKNIILERFRNLCQKNFLDYYMNIKSEEKKGNDDEYLKNFFEKGHDLDNNVKRMKKLNLTINEVDSSIRNLINKKNQKGRAIFLNKDKISKCIINTVKSNGSSKTSENFFDDVVNYLQSSKKDKKTNGKFKKEIIVSKNNNSVNNIYFDNKILNEEEESDRYEFNKNTIEESKSLINLNKSKIKKKNNTSYKQFKFPHIQEIQFDENNKNKNLTNNNILNKNNKKIILYPILLKKSKSNEKMKINPYQNKNKYKKKKINKDKSMIQKEDINTNKEEKSIFSLILNGLPNFNNKFINQNLKHLKKCENFKNALIIDKNLIKLSKERSFFYKGCESLLTMSNNPDQNFIPIIDLLRYDELFELKYGVKKRNFSANTRTNNNYKLN